MNLTADLSCLFNVVEESERLKRVMPCEAVEKCIHSGETNAARVAVLCARMVHDVKENNLNLLNCLSGYCLERSNAYSSMHQRLRDIVPCTDGEGQTQLCLLQERVKVLSEESFIMRREKAEIDSLAKLLVEINNKIAVSSAREDSQRLREETHAHADIVRLECLVKDAVAIMKQQGNTLRREHTETSLLREDIQLWREETDVHAHLTRLEIAVKDAVNVMKQQANNIRRECAELASLKEDVRQMRQNTPAHDDMERLEHMLKEAINVMKQQGSSTRKEYKETVTQINSQLANISADLQSRNGEDNSSDDDVETTGRTLCWYHSKFGWNADKCVGRCDWND